MNRILLIVVLCFLQILQGQAYIKTHLKTKDITSLFSVSSLKWAIPVSQSQKLSLQWSERQSSFTKKAGIRTFVGYDGSSFVATLSVLKTGELSGDFSWKGSQWRISTSRDGYFSITKESSEDQCGGCNHGYCDAHDDIAIEGNRLHTFLKTSAQSKKIHTDNFLRVFRLAVLVDKHYYNRYGSKEAVKGFWSRLETSLNEYYTREIGIRFEIVDREELIIDSTPVFDGKTASSIVSGATTKISELIGKDNYDAGIVIARNKDTNIAGLAVISGVNRSASKARAMANNSSRIIAHELGHLFGSAHTFTTGGSGTITTEPGNGQSIMSYGTPVNFFSLPSIYFIRETVRANTMVGTLKNNEAPVIDTTKLSREYTLPKETFFQFKIDATDSDGDPLLYAFHQADIRKNNAQFESEKSTRDNTKAFYNHWVMGSFVKREYDLSAGKAYTFWLGVNDTKDTYNEMINHPTRYDMYETKVKYVDGIPFKITNFQSKKYKTGEKVTLTWSVDEVLKNYKVRILLSDDFGQTFNHVLVPETQNDGSCEIVMPHTTIGRKVYHQVGNTPIFHSGLGLIKIELLDHIAFALTNNDVTGNGGFEVEASAITFTKTPKQYIKVTDESSIPDEPIEAISTCSGNSTLQLSLNETRYQNFITRTWTAVDNCGNTSSFVQHIEIEQPTIPKYLVFTKTPEATISVSCDDIPNANYLQFETNGCTSVSFTHQDTKIGNGCSYTIERVFRATGCGESIIFKQLISVFDNQKPTFVGDLPADMVLKQGQNIPEQVDILAIDNCTVTPQILKSKEEVMQDGNKAIIYKWKALDDCGNFFEHSQTITLINENLETEELRYSTLKIYPNPTTNVFQLRGGNSVSSIKIYNASGKLVKVFDKSQRDYLISELHKGVYLVSVTQTDGAVKTFKIIKK